MRFIDNLKEAIKIVQKLDNIELYQKILDLQADGLNISSELIEKDKKINDLENEIKDYKEKLRFKKKLVFKRSLYYEQDEKGDLINPPYCPKCWEAEQKPIHIIVDPSTKRSVCPNCKNNYDVNIYCSPPKS